MAGSLASASAGLISGTAAAQEASAAPAGAVATVAVAPPAAAEDPVRAGIRSSFALPLADLYTRRHESAARELLDGLTVAPGLIVPFNSRGTGAGSSGSALSGSTAVTLDFRYQPVGYWFGEINLIGYLQPSKRAPWNGDFTYSFGYDDWHPYTFSLVYSNYTNNRFSPRPGDPVTFFDRGTVSFGWKAPLPGGRHLLFDRDLAINCRVGVNVSPRYERQDGSVGSGKESVNLGCRYPFTRYLFVDLNVFGYAHGQQPWDPDFTYGFGFADYRSGHFSLTYANYSGNRFPGRHRAANTGTFGDGGLFLTWNRQF